MNRFNFLTDKCIFQKSQHHKFETFLQPWWDIQLWGKIPEIFWRGKPLKSPNVDSFALLQFRINKKIHKKISEKDIRETCWINSKIRNRDKNTTPDILILALFWSLLWWNYWSCLILWSSTSWNRLRLTVQIQLALHPYVLLTLNLVIYCFRLKHHYQHVLFSSKLLQILAISV